MTTTSQILRAAAEYLREYGWHQGNFSDLTVPVTDDPPCCAVGAIGMAFLGEPAGVSDAAVVMLADRLVAKYGVERHPFETAMNVIAKWNDSPNQTAENVISTLLECAKELEK